MNEAFGIIQLEALAQGKPIINTRLGTGVDWVSLQGLLVKQWKLMINSSFKRLYLSSGQIQETLAKYGDNARDRYLEQFTPGNFGAFWLNHLR